MIAILKAVSVALPLTLFAAGFSSARAQTMPPTTASVDSSYVSIGTNSTGARIRVLGRAQYRGAAPLDIPWWLNGRSSILVEGPGTARTQGVIYLPDRADGITSLASEPPGMSAGLVVRSLNLPGVPDLTARRMERGIALGLAGAGAGFGALRDHLQYRDRLREFGPYAADRAANARHARNGWFTYGLAVWGASAVDYWMRPRFGLVNSEAGRTMLDVPSVTRGAAAWRSLIVPGAGQEFANHSTRGAVWLAAFLGAGAGFVIADNRVDRDQTEVAWARALVDSAGPSDRAARVHDVAVREHDLQTSEDLRRGFRIALYGIYAANVVDALVMPLRRPPESDPPRISATFPIGPDRAAFALRYRF